MARPAALLLALLAVAALAPAAAQPDSRYFIALLTVGPGETYWERFGHNALVVRDRRTGRSVSYNYGIFDFRQEHFLLRFVRGHMLYRLAAFDGGQDIAAYRDSGRRVSVQDLDLAPEQAEALVAFLEWNRLPDNAAYRYDYFRDNCSTRIRDALDEALSGALSSAAAARVTSHDYRWHVRRLTAPVPWLYLGTQVGLGRPVDRPISAWEAMFLPMELAAFVDAARLGDGRPLVSARWVLEEGDIAEPAAPPSPWPWFLAAGVILALGTGSSRSLALGWWGLSGTAGLILSGLWLFTDHWAAQANENLLVLSPLGWVAVLAWRRARGVARATAGALALLATLALAGHLAGWLPQGNLEILLAAAPVHLAALLTARRA